MEISEIKVIKAQFSIIFEKMKSNWKWLLFFIIFLIPILFSAINQASKTAEVEYAIVKGGGIDTSSDMALPHTVLKFELLNRKQRIVWAPPGTPVQVNKKIKLDVYRRIISGSIEYRFNRYIEDTESTNK